MEEMGKLQLQNRKADEDSWEAMVAEVEKVRDALKLIQLL